MRRNNQQADLIELLEVGPGDHVLEVGFGGGGLVRALAERTGADVIYGVDPSADMVELASSHNRRHVRSGRVRLIVGSADDTGLADQCVDVVVTVNTVAIWPDLDRGVRELHRVVRPGGQVVVAWHGGRAPSRLQRRLRIPAEGWERVADTLVAEFGAVRRAQCASLDVLLATREPA